MASRMIRLGSYSLITFLVAGSIHWALSFSAAPPIAAEQKKATDKKDGPQKRAEALGIKFEKKQPGYLNWCTRSGKLLFTSGFSSKIKGQLGKNLTIKEGQAAARECALDVLQAVHDRHGTLDGLRVIKVLGCVNATADFTDHPKVINGASDLLHEIFGKDSDGHHARSALGFSSLPFGAAVEVEAIFEVKE